MELLATTYLLLFFTIGWLLIYLAYTFEQRMLAQRRGWQRLLVIVPQAAHHPSATSHASEIEQSGELYRRLGELRIPFTLELAVHALGEEIHFYIIVPRFRAKNVIRLIESLWPTGSVAFADEYELWLADSPAEESHVTGAYLRQARPACIPLKTAFKGRFEPFLGILRRMAGLAAVGEGAAVQWVIRPADPALIRDIGRHLQKFNKGEYHPSRHVHESFILTPQTVKLLEEKAGSPLFAVNCRVVVAGIRGTGKTILRDLTGEFDRAVSTGDQHNYFAATTVKDTPKLLTAFFDRRFEQAQEMVLTADELATYFHFPGADTAAPKIKR